MQVTLLHNLMLIHQVTSNIYQQPTINSIVLYSASKKCANFGKL